MKRVLRILLCVAYILSALGCLIIGAIGTIDTTLNINGGAYILSTILLGLTVYVLWED